MDYAEAAALLQAEGGAFELTTARIPGQGRDVKVWKQRERSLREKVANAAVHGDKPFLVDDERRISFAEFVELTWGAAHALLNDFGLKRHDRVGILAYNRPEWLITLFGAASAGGTCVGLNGWWTSEEIVYALNDSDCKYLIVDELLWERAKPLLGQVSALETVFYIGKDAPAGTVPIERLLQRRSDMPMVPLEEDDPFVILYTSGTTGRAKGCITTHRGTVAQVHGILYNYFMGLLLKGAGEGAALPQEPATLLTSPLFHVAGLHSTVVTALSTGAKLVFGPPRFDVKQTLRLMQKERITTWMAIPTLLQRVVNHDSVHDYDLSSLTMISTGGAPTAPETAERSRQVFKTHTSLATSYGLTEVHGMATSIAGDEYSARPNSVGRPAPIVEIRIVDDKNEPVAVGKPGHVLLGGPTVTPGYWRRPLETEQTVIDGWLHTGDIGYLDAEGYLYISDRAKDMVIRAGENVYCVEVENTLAEHPDIIEAAVFGVPDSDLGERVKAVVVLRQHAQLTAADVKSHVSRRLAKFKVPEDVEFTKEPLPRNPAGKILKNILRRTGTVSFPPELHF